MSYGRTRTLVFLKMMYHVPILVSGIGNVPAPRQHPNKKVQTKHMT
jgi:hypothetical protein